MRQKLKKYYLICNLWRTWGGYILLGFLGKDYRQRVVDECRYWCKLTNAPKDMNRFLMWSWLLIYEKEYRNLAIRRLSKNIVAEVFANILFVFLPRVSSLYITTRKIGWNLYIQHGFATIIAAKSIGENCWINQQVTIGYSSSKEPPTIGNGVHICAGAIVIGDIVIGDNSIVGANATVTKNVAENEVVAGVPAKRIGINNNPLYIK